MSSTSQKIVKIGIVKCGCIGTAPLLEYLLDERADREDISVRVYSSGAKLIESEAEDVAKLATSREHDLYIFISPNAALPGPRKAIEILKNTGKPTIVISDAPAKKATKDFEGMGVGYIIVLGDPMIGARREFLDPTEMAIFNGDIIRLLAICGVFRIIYKEIDKVINAIKAGQKPELPKLVIDKSIIEKECNITNPYAKAKAIAAYEIAQKVSELTTEACFKIKEWERYTLLCTAAHEILRVATRLADEVRELDKSIDAVVREPHHRDGTILMKIKLIEKPEKKA